MSSNGINVAAFTGAGEIGKYILDRFLEDKNVTSIILTRDTSKAELQPYAQRGAKLVAVNYEDQASLTKALQGVDAVVSTLSAQTPANVEPELARAAAAAGVKLFVPSFFGNDYWNPKSAPLHPIVQAKVEFSKRLVEEFKLPVFAITNGLFAHFAFHPGFGFDVAARKALRIPGDGTSSFSLTHPKDVAGFTHHLVTTQPLPAAGEIKYFYIQGFAASFHDLLAEAEKQDARSWEKAYWPLEELEAKQLEPSMLGFLSWLGAGLSDGRSHISPDRINAEQVGYKPTIGREQSVKELLAAAK